MEQDAEEGPPSARDGLLLGAHWGFLAFFAGFAGYQLSTLLLTALLNGRVTDFDPEGSPQLGPLVLLAFLPNLMLGLAPVVVARFGGSLAELGLRPRLADVRIGLACGGFALLAGYLGNLLLLSVFGTDADSGNPLDGMSQEAGEGFVWILIAALVLVFIAPLTEELLIRGALWNALAHVRIPPWVILVLTAVVFAQLHGEPSRTLALFAQGLAIGAARLLSGRTSASVIAHLANNLPPALLLLGGQ